MSDELDDPQDAGDDADAAADAKSKKVKVKKAKKVKEVKEKKVKAPKAAKDKAGKKGFPLVLVLVPVALIAALVLAFTLPPTHALLMKSPLGPLIARLTHESPKATAAGAKPTPDPVADVKRLNAALAGDKAAAVEKDARIAQLQAQVSQLQTPAKSSPAPTPQPSPTAVPEDVKRAAGYWAAMDADKAADIIKQLPDAYVKAVLSQMPPDSVSDILSALPAKTAARLTVGGQPAAGSDSP